jgi:hypothetical protein
VFDAEKFFKHPLPELRGNARPGVRHGNLQESFPLVRRILPGRNPNRNLTGPRRILEGVGEEVGEDNAQPGRIPPNDRFWGLPIDTKRNFGIFVPGVQDADRLVDDGIEIDPFLLEAQLAGLDPRQVKQLVDGIGQFLPALERGGQDLALAGR